MNRIVTGIGLAGLLASTPALAQTNDNAPEALSSAPELKHDKKESWTYIKPGLNLAGVTAMQIEPTAVYRGADAQFHDVSEADREKYAVIMTEALQEQMGKSFQLITRPTANAIRLKLTLIGASKTTGGLATVSSVLPIGLLTNAVKSAAGKKGTFTGSALVAVEIFDSTTNELLAAAVRREVADALDISATISTTETVKSIASAFAISLHNRLLEAKSRKP
ncbi:DUF3313 domain-containing protein [Novosphingobium panipatense]|jgi:hypothetical protein|uniref:DUF3313 domain-containing protein n=1 Tax=Novosphingobium panipatense TaxID=428991 RepID=UPI0039A3A7F2